MTFLFLELPQFTKKPPPKVIVQQGTTVSLCCMATGSPRSKVEWSRHQRSTLFSPFFQEDGCLAVKTTKAHGEEDYICRATNSFGLSETTKLNPFQILFILISFTMKKIFIVKPPGRSGPFFIVSLKKLINLPFSRVRCLKF